MKRRAVYRHLTQAASSGGEDDPDQRRREQKRSEVLQSLNQEAVRVHPGATLARPCDQSVQRAVCSPGAVACHEDELSGPGVEEREGHRGDGAEGAQAGSDGSQVVLQGCPERGGEQCCAGHPEADQLHPLPAVQGEPPPDHLLIHTEGRYRMWYQANPHEVGPGEQPDYELRCTDSVDGITDWSPPQVFAGPDEGCLLTGQSDPWGVAA